jgi:hypothetical protein
MAGTLKRCAYLDSLRKKNKECKKISNPYEFYLWTQGKIQEAQQEPGKDWKISTAFVSTERVQEVSNFLQKRFSTVLKVPKIRDQHSLNPVSKSVISTKRYSYGTDFALVPVESVRILPLLEDLAQAQYVAVQENQNWILGEVQLFDDSTAEVLLKLMYKERSPSMWRIIEDEDEYSYNIEDILAIATPTFTNGIYHLSEEDITKIVWQFNVVKGIKTLFLMENYTN